MNKLARYLKIKSSALLQISRFLTETRFVEHVPVLQNLISLRPVEPCCTFNAQSTSHDSASPGINEKRVRKIRLMDRIERKKITKQKHKNLFTFLQIDVGSGLSERSWLKLSRSHSQHVGSGDPWLDVWVVFLGCSLRWWKDGLSEVKAGLQASMQGCDEWRPQFYNSIFGCGHAWTAAFWIFERRYFVFVTARAWDQWQPVMGCRHRVSQGNHWSGTLCAPHSPW